MAAYAGMAPLMAYDPAGAFSPGQEKSSNPRLVRYNGQDDGWRPMAMIEGPGEKAYLGSQAGYGRLDGALTIWEPASDRVESFPGVVKDQSVASLAVSRGLIVGGTGIVGGGGARPTQTSAKLFVWDPILKQKTFETVPVPGARDISNLLSGPSGQVYGIAGGDRLFVFDPETSRVLSVTQLPFQSVIHNSLLRGPDGAVWGLAGDGIFTLDVTTKRARIVAHPPAPITAGGVADDRVLYFSSGPRIYGFALPRN
jgi:hypothetical protein